MKTKKLVDLAKTIRSKNAGTDRITLTSYLKKRNYEHVKASNNLKGYNI